MPYVSAGLCVSVLHCTARTPRWLARPARQEAITLGHTWSGADQLQMKFRIHTKITKEIPKSHKDNNRNSEIT